MGGRRHRAHVDFVDAVRRLAAVRDSFTELAKQKLILGNDNHIGDIGEYWMRRYYEQRGIFCAYGNGKTALCDIKLADGTAVSVKTITEWSKTGYGTPIRPLDGSQWTVLAAVFLGADLFPKRIAVVPLADLRKQPVFLRNEARRAGAKPTQSYPRFAWWDWLENYEVRFSIVDDDLVLAGEPDGPQVLSVL